MKPRKFPVINCETETDIGTEIYNRSVKVVFEMYRLNHYNFHSEIKAAPVEQFIRAIKYKMYKSFTAKICIVTLMY